MQRDGGWGWSNAGLVVDGDASLLVDTLFDLRLTADMLESMRRATAAAEQIDIVVNTHANGDHCYGNELVAGAEIVASQAQRGGDGGGAAVAARRVRRRRPRPRPHSASTSQAIFGDFSFDGIEVVAADPHLRRRAAAAGRRPRRPPRTSSGRRTPPATSSSTCPTPALLFTGDLVFHGGHPIVWAGPVQRWIDACDRMLALDAAVVVPGHGPVGDRAAIEDAARLLRVAGRRGHAAARPAA